MINLITDLPQKGRQIVHTIARRGLSYASNHIPEFTFYSKFSRLGRKTFEHKNVKRVLGGNIALAVLVSSMTPVAASNRINDSVYEQTVISANSVDINTKAHIQYPLDRVKINQGYSFFHRGVDLDGEIGDTVKPIMEGIVVEVQHSSFSYGNAVLVQHAEGFSSIYAHLSKATAEVGQRVDLNTKIGEVGSTGHSTGPHLHLEIRENGNQINPFSMLP